MLHLRKSRNTWNLMLSPHFSSKLKKILMWDHRAEHEPYWASPGGRPWKQKWTEMWLWTIHKVELAKKKKKKLCGFSRGCVYEREIDRHRQTDRWKERGRSGPGTRDTDFLVLLFLRYQTRPGINTYKKSKRKNFKEKKKGFFPPLFCTEESLISPHWVFKLKTFSSRVLRPVGPV